MSTSKRSHVIVVGGGIFGAAAAAALVERGVRVSLVVDGSLAGGASGRSLAWLNAAWKWRDPYFAIRMAGIDRWRTWGARHEGSERYLRFDGGLMWADEQDDESFRDLFIVQRNRGYASTWIDPKDVARFAPGVNPRAVAREGAILNPGEGWVDLPSVIRVLAAEIVAGGGRVIENTGPATPIISGDRAIGVHTASGEDVRGDAVLLATGPGVPEQLDQLGIRIGTSSPLAFVAFTEPVSTALRLTLNTPHVAIRRTVDGGLAMDSGWSERSITIGEDGAPQVAEEVIARLVDEARLVLDGAPALSVTRIGLGYKPVPADGEPVYGSVDGVDDLFVAFSHSGATQGLIAGELLAEEIATGFVSPLMSTFRVARFTAFSASGADADR